MIKPKIGEHLEKISNKKLKQGFIACIILLLVSAPSVIYFLESSGFPGELERTQLGFDAEYIRDCLISMTEQGLTYFMLGNLADYLFMVSYGGGLFTSTLLLSRRFDEPSLLRSLSIIVSFLGLSAALSDGLENIFIISMASNPANFPVWLAFPHSLFAHIKFKLMYLSAAWIAFALLYLTMRFALRTIKQNWG